MFAELNGKWSWLHERTHGSEKFVCERHFNDKHRDLTWLLPPTYTEFVGLVWI